MGGFPWTSALAGAEWARSGALVVFTGAEQIYGRLEDAIQGAREALEVERLALVQAEGERKARAVYSLPATVEDAATEARVESVRRYQALGIERDAREAALTELERLLPAPEQTLSVLAEATVCLLEAVVTIDREAFVRRVGESGELEQLRGRFERLRVTANTHAAEIDEWSQQVGRPLRIPQVAFPWPPAPVWQALLSSPTEAPELVWDDDATTPNA